MPSVADLSTSYRYTIDGKEYESKTRSEAMIEIGKALKAITAGNLGRLSIEVESFYRDNPRVMDGLTRSVEAVKESKRVRRGRLRTAFYKSALFVAKRVVR